MSGKGLGQIDVSVYKKFRYVLFTGLYLGEGLYQTVLILITPLYLLDKNVPIPIITLVVGIGELPWALKFVWGGIIDFYHKYGRKKFTIFGTIIGALGFLLIGFTDQFFSIYSYTILLFIGHTGIGFLDAAADAWAIDVSTKEDRGKINAFMHIGKSVSGAIGGPLLVVMAISFGYNVSFLVTGFVILFLALIPSVVKYIDRGIKRIELWSLIKQEFSFKATRLFTTYQLIIVLNPSLINSLLVIIGKTVLLWEDTFLALTGVISLFFGTIPGSIIGGILADRMGRKRSLVIFLSLMLIVSLIPVFTFDINNLNSVAIFDILVWLCLLNFSWAGMTATNWAMAMDIINPKIGSVQHEIMCSIGNFGDSVISAAAGTIFILIGLSNIFVLASIIVVISIGFLYQIHSDKIK